MERKQLILVKCLPATLDHNSSPPETLATLQSYLVQLGILQPMATIEEFLSRLFRLVIAPYPLPLSIALALLPYVREIFIDESVVDPNERAPQVTNLNAFLGEHSSKVVKYYGKNTLAYCFNIPEDCYTLAIVTTVFADNAKDRSYLHGNGLLWPKMHGMTDEGLLESCLGEQEQKREEEVDYWDDDTAARIQVQVVKKVEKLLQQQARPSGNAGNVQLKAVELPEFTPLGLDSSTVQEHLSSLATSCNSLLSTLTALKSRLSS